MYVLESVLFRDLRQYFGSQKTNFVYSFYKTL